VTCCIRCESSIVLLHSVYRNQIIEEGYARLADIRIDSAAACFHKQYRQCAGHSAADDIVMKYVDETDTINAGRMRQFLREPRLSYERRKTRWV